MLLSICIPLKRKYPLQLQQLISTKKTRLDISNCPADGSNVPREKAALQSACLEADNIVKHFKEGSTEEKNEENKNRRGGEDKART